METRNKIDIFSPFVIRPEQIVGEPSKLNIFSLPESKTDTYYSSMEEFVRNLSREKELKNKRIEYLRLFESPEETDKNNARIWELTTLTEKVPVRNLYERAREKKIKKDHKVRKYGYFTLSIALELLRILGDNHFVESKHIRDTCCYVFSYFIVGGKIIRCIDSDNTHHFWRKASLSVFGQDGDKLLNLYKNNTFLCIINPAASSFHLMGDSKIIRDMESPELRDMDKGDVYFVKEIIDIPNGSHYTSWRLGALKIYHLETVEELYERYGTLMKTDLVRDIVGKIVSIIIQLLDQ